jgi:hypothetical protein
MCTLSGLSILLKLKEIKLHSEQCSFVAKDLRFLRLSENYLFINATLFCRLKYFPHRVLELCLDLISTADLKSTQTSCVSPSVDRQKMILLA